MTAEDRIKDVFWSMLKRQMELETEVERLKPFEPKPIVEDKTA